MKNRNCFLIFVLVCALGACCSQPQTDAVLNAIVPHPASVEVLEDEAFLLDRSAALVYTGNGAVNSAEYLKDYLQEHYGLSLRKRGGRVVELQIVPDSAAVQGAYSLEVSPRKISIVGKNEPGLFYGVQTLLQLLPVAAVSGSEMSAGVDTGGKMEGKLSGRRYWFRR